LGEYIGHKYTKFAVKTPQISKEIAVFSPQSFIYEEKSCCKCKDDYRDDLIHILSAPYQDILVF